MNNHIPLSVAELKSVLPGLSKVVSKKATLPVLGCVRVERNSQGEVFIQGTDLDSFATVRIKEAIPGPVGSFLVPFEPLAKAVKSSSNKSDIVLTDEGDKGITLRTFAGGSPFDQKLERIDIKEWPPVPVVKEKGIIVDEEVRNTIQEAFECASDDPSRHIINGVYLDVVDPKAHYVVSTNGRSLYSANSFSFGLKESLLIPTRKFLGWAGLWDEEHCWLSRENSKKSGGWVQVKTDNWSFITKQIEGNFPNWKQVVPTGTPLTVINLNGEANKTLLEVVPKLPGGSQNNSPITLTAGVGGLSVEGRNQTADKPMSVAIEGASITGKKIRIGVNRHFFIQALRFGLNEIQLTDELSPLVCRSQGKRFVVMPLRPDQPPTSAASPATTATAEAKEPTNDERTEMTRTASTKTETNKPAEASTSLIDQVEQIKETLKNVLRDLSNLVDAVKLAEKEKRTNEKEVEAARATLKKLQQVTI